MSLAVEVAYSGEGATDAAVARRLIVAAGGEPGLDYGSRRLHHGKEALDRSIPGLNAVAARRPVLILRDLDRDAPCGGSLVAGLVSKPSRGLCLRIAVRSVEAWLMADRESFAKEGGLPEGRISNSPETLPDPKRQLLDQFQHSRKRRVRQIIGDEPGKGFEPQLFADFLIEFAREHWDPKRAATSGRAPSLVRALKRLSKLIATAP